MKKEKKTFKKNGLFFGTIIFLFFIPAKFRKDEETFPAVREGGSLYCTLNNVTSEAILPKFNGTNSPKKTKKEGEKKEKKRKRKRHSSLPRPPPSPAVPSGPPSARP